MGAAGRRARPGLSDLQLDRARRLGVHLHAGAARAPGPLLRPDERDVFERDGMLDAHRDGQELAPGEETFRETVRFRTVGDMSCTGGVRSRASTITEVIGEIAATRITERAKTRADDRVSEAAMEEQAGRVLLMSLDLLRFTTAGSVDDGKSTLIGRMLYDSKQVFADQLAHRATPRCAAGARASSTSRSSPTASGPSASRGSRSTWPTGTSPPPAGGSSSPTAPATSSTRATWSPAPRPPTWPSWCSTPAKGPSSSPSATPSSAPSWGSPISWSP